MPAPAPRGPSLQGRLQSSTAYFLPLRLQPDGIAFERLWEWELLRDEEPLVHEERVVVRVRVGVAVGAAVVDLDLAERGDHALVADGDHAGNHGAAYGTKTP